jgi:glycosyltransferase involved in cell wall biosynthesis
MSVDSKHLLTDPPEALSVAGGVLSKTRRVLVVSYDFPPNRTSAVYRMTGLTRSLPEFGWQPTVLTIHAGAGAQEPRLLEKLPPAVDVVRTRFVRINGWENQAASAVHTAGGLQSAPDDRQPRLDRYLRSVAELVRSTLYFPDDTVGWVPFALAKAIRLHREHPFDLVYTTSPPRSAPIIGLLLKILCGVPWVCEFMDPWYPPQGRLRRRSEDRLQALLLRKADRVVVMIKQHAEEFRRSFHVAPEKLAVVRNGFFEEDFASAEATEKNPLAAGYFHFSHFGSIYPNNYGSFFSALTEVVRESPELKEWLRLNIVGFPCESLLRYTSEGELKDIIKVHGFVPDRADVLKMMRSSDCLLLFWGDPDFSRLAVAGKTYDYLRSGRPILAITHEGGVKELVEEAQAGWVASPENTQAIKQALRAVLRNYPENPASRPAKPEFIAQFRWDRQAQHLARVFHEAVSNGR